MRVDICDISHHDRVDSFHAFQDSGIVGVILKATEGTGYVDHEFAGRYTRAISVFGERCVHSYHMLTGEDAARQMRHYMAVTDGKPGRWLDYERTATWPSLQTAVDACHALADQIGRFPGMYGSDKDLLGKALLSGHFTVCPLWIASYSRKPLHACQLWQTASGESKLGPRIAGEYYDVNQFMGGDGAACQEWMKQLAN